MAATRPAPGLPGRRVPFSVRCGAAVPRCEPAPSGSGAAESAVPIRTPSAPPAAACRTSASVAMPLSAIATRSAGMRASSDQAACTSIAKVSRFRLLTPMHPRVGIERHARAPARHAPRPGPPGRAPGECRAARAGGPPARARTISSTAEAPAPRASSDLGLVEDEVLAQQWDGDRGGNGAEIVEGTAEEGTVGEDRDGRGTGAGIGRGVGHRIQLRADRRPATAIGASPRR